MRDSRVGVGSRKTFNGAAFAEDIEAEEHDFRATLKQATQERADFAKGLVFVKDSVRGPHRAFARGTRQNQG